MKLVELLSAKNQAAAAVRQPGISLNATARNLSERNLHNNPDNNFESFLSSRNERPEARGRATETRNEGRTDFGSENRPITRNENRAERRAESRTDVRAERNSNNPARNRMDNSSGNRAASAGNPADARTEVMDGTAANAVCGEASGETSNEVSVSAVIEAAIAAKVNEDEFLKEFAAVLGISVGELLALLSDMGFDVEEGLYTSQIGRIVAAVHNVSDPVELLWQPEAVEMTKELDELVKMYVKSAAVSDSDEVKAKVSSEPAANTEQAPKQALAAQGTDSEAKYEQVMRALDEAVIIRHEGQKTETANQGANADEAMKFEAKAETENKPKAQTKTANESAANAAAGTSADDSAEETNVSDAKPAAAQTSAHNHQIADKSAADAKVNQGEAQGINQTAAQPTQTTGTPTAASRPVQDNAEVVKQITDYLKSEARPDTTELRLTLRPQSLGEIMMRVVTQNGIVTAQLYAESQRIKEIIEASLNELKNALTDKGIEVSEMQTFVTQDDRQREAFMNQGQRVQGGRVSEIMRRNGMAAGDAEELGTEPQMGVNTAKNPLEVDILT